MYLRKEMRLKGNENVAKERRKSKGKISKRINWIWFFTLFFLGFLWRRPSVCSFPGVWWVGHKHCRFCRWGPESPHCLHFTALRLWLALFCWVGKGQSPGHLELNFESRQAEEMTNWARSDGGFWVTLRGVRIWVGSDRGVFIWRGVWYWRFIISPSSWGLFPFSLRLCCWECSNFQSFSTPCWCLGNCEVRPFWGNNGGSIRPSWGRRKNLWRCFSSASKKECCLPFRKPTPAAVHSC